MTKEEVLAVLDYDPNSGLFTWRTARGGKTRVGAIAGSIDSSGYRQIRVGGRYYLAHRLVFLVMTGRLPAHHVDHINGVRTDNRWENLREATRAQNSVNRRPRADRIGLTGVLVVGRRFQSAICIRENGQKRRLHLGMFATAQEAHAAYLLKARELHGEFAQ